MVYEFKSARGLEIQSEMMLKLSHLGKQAVKESNVYPANLVERERGTVRRIL